MIKISNNWCLVENENGDLDVVYYKPIEDGLLSRNVVATFMKDGDLKVFLKNEE